MKQILSLVMAFAMFGVIFSVLPSAYSQTSDVETSEQTTFLGDLLNDPMALEILKKIEESKRKIIKLEQQNYDNLQAQKFLEDRRVVALKRLNQSLVLFEEEWHEFSPKVAYQKFVDKISDGDAKGVFLKQFAFTEKKHSYGVTAKTKALDRGMNSYESMVRFNDAAKSTVSEITKYNEKIQPNYAESLKKKNSERMEYWDDMLNNRDELIKQDKSAIERDYSIQLAVVSQDERIEIRKIIKDYDAETITRIELSHELGTIREKYNPIKEEILNKKEKALSKLEPKYDNWIPGVVNKLMSSKNPIDAHIGIVWNSDTKSYEVVLTKSVFSIYKPIITGLVTAPTEIQLFWNSPASIDKVLVTGYKIEMKTDDQPYVILVKDTGNRNTSYTHTDLISGQFYTYRISAITDIEISDSSNEFGASTPIS